MEFTQRVGFHYIWPEESPGFKAFRRPVSKKPYEGFILVYSKVNYSQVNKMFINLEDSAALVRHYRLASGSSFSNAVRSR
jgi:hypothetical protein